MSRARLALVVGAVLLAIGLVLASTAPRSSAAEPSAAPSVAGRHVLLLSGWNGSASNWNTAKAQREAAGETVHVVSLPRGGSNAGDTAVNATAVQDYIASHSLTDVQLDGHSLGGWLALYVALVRRDPAVTSVVLRDTGYGCFFGIPRDPCAGADMLAASEGAAPSTVPILNLSSKTAALPQVDCLRTYSLGHNDFLTNAAVTSAAIGWPAASPCGPAPTPTSTPSPTATATATSTPTATPTATATPAPVCTWWDRLWGRC